MKDNITRLKLTEKDNSEIESLYKRIVDTKRCIKNYSSLSINSDLSSITPERILEVVFKDEIYDRSFKRVDIDKILDYMGIKIHVTDNSNEYAFVYKNKEGIKIVINSDIQSWSGEQTIKGYFRDVVVAHELAHVFLHFLKGKRFDEKKENESILNNIKAFDIDAVNPSFRNNVDEFHNRLYASFKINSSEKSEIDANSFALELIFPEIVLKHNSKNEIIKSELSKFLLPDYLTKKSRVKSFY